MLPELHAREFGAYFYAVHGSEPFPWQNRLAQHVFQHGWPDALDVPTGAGKTSAIDVALFHLALEAAMGSARRAPTRILFVVDRRLVVDDTFERAKRIERALAQNPQGILRRIAERLSLLAEDGRPPVAAVRLRGGAPKEPDWVRTPSQPTIVASTVDQIGSRLFFRGYGVSDRMKPVHAGLLGCDSLLLLDEAHLSQPFVQTVRDARPYQDELPWSENAAPAPFQSVTLSATQVAAGALGIDDDDRAHSILGMRLNASKPATLLDIAAKSDQQAFVQAFAERAWGLSKAGRGTAVTTAVVVNRVRLARAVFETLQSNGARVFGQGRDTEPECVLMIGRSRPLEREAFLAQLLARIRSGAPRTDNDTPLFVVATQCVEAGADLDFDALVTEIAPLDSLRQRFGRLNRLGRSSESPAAILAAKDQIAAKANDPIYGVAPRETWRLLTESAAVQGRGKDAVRVLDFGQRAADIWLPKGDGLGSFLAPREDAPILLAPHVELWSHTAPVPAVDPEISFYLHGPDNGPADVQIVWRADLDDEDSEEDWIDRLRVCPPAALEMLSTPLAQARQWLRGFAPADLADVEANASETAALENVRKSRKALRWYGADSEKSCFVEAAKLRPGDVIVVSTLGGGCDSWGWAPSSTQPVADLGEAANEQGRGHVILRPSARLLLLALREEGVGEAQVLEQTVLFEDFLDEMREASSREVRARLAAYSGLPRRWKQRLAELGGAPLLHRTDGGRPLALEARKRTQANDAVTEDDDSVCAPRAMTLSVHSKQVESLARRFAEQAGLLPRYVEDVALAGFLHDAGKAHPAFKRFLYGGDELAAIGGPDLAKSKKLPQGGQAWDEAHARARLPRGARHEVASLAFALAHPRLRDAHDSDLVLWLVGTHHGFGRPFFPAVAWPLEGEKFAADLDASGICLQSQPALSLAELTARWCDMFASLKRRYGPWGLARFEAILRLADHRQSEAGEEEDDGAP